MQFTADQIWAMSVAADRINGGYVKDTVMNYDVEPPVVAKEANKLMVKRWLREGHNPATEQDAEEGRRVRKYFNTFTLKALTGQINDFERTALKVSQMDEFTSRNTYEFAIISCLPSVARRDQQRTELKREIYTSEQLIGNVGDVIVGDITVISSRFNQNYCKYKITARMGESFIDFWHGQELAGEIRIKGKIKNVRGDKTTQLNYVKKVG